MRLRSPLIVILLAGGCAASKPVEVEVFGSLRGMFHEDRIGPEIDLDRLLPAPDLFAVGALAGLRGEVTVRAGEAFISYPDGPASARTETPVRPDEEAALLVLAHVPRWQGVRTDDDITFDDLDLRIAELASRAGVDTSRPFPFLIEGRVTGLQWHVIDGSRLAGGGGSHEDHLRAAVRLSSDEAEVVIVGFYSDRHQGIFTHRGSKTHLHCVIEEPLSSGHVDQVVLPAGVLVRLPAAR